MDDRVLMRLKLLPSDVRQSSQCDTTTHISHGRIVPLLIFSECVATEAGEERGTIAQVRNALQTRFELPELMTEECTRQASCDGPAHHPRQAALHVLDLMEPEVRRWGSW